MTHEQTSAMWLARWHGQRGSGLKMTEYAKHEGFNAHSAYRWLRRARLSGVWFEPAAQSGQAVAVRKASRTVFARVTVSDPPASTSAMLLRVVLTNGRRAELEVGGVAQLGEVLDVLERRA
jgi:hypothetical protein